MESELVEHISAEGYHPRTSKHSDFQSLIIIRDLVRHCPLIAERAAAGEIVAKLRHHQQVGFADWVIDIAIGTSSTEAGNRNLLDQTSAGQIGMAPPVMIEIAIELKSIWTEHGKARLNRLRDFNSFHGYAHQYNPKTVAGAYLVVNSSEIFWSPLREQDDITEHNSKSKTARQIARETVDKFRSINLRNSETDAGGIEALGITVIEHDNLIKNPNFEALRGSHKPTRIAPSPPSVPIGDPLHYESMIQRICAQYTERFS